MRRSAFEYLMVDTDAATNGMTLLYLEQLLGRRRQQPASEPPRLGVFEAKSGLLPSRIEIDENLHFMPASFVMRQTEDTRSRSIQGYA